MPLPERVYGVWLATTFVGTLRQRGDHTAFRIHPSYADDPARPVLGLIFEQDLDHVHAAAQRLPPWFSNLLPEGALRQWIADQRRVSERREMELLAEVGHDLPGAVTVMSLPDGALGSSNDDPPMVPTRESPAGGDVADADPRGRFSLAGVQLKLSMIAAGDRLVVPLGGSRGDWIVKFPDAKFPDLPVVEFVTMSLARAAGITVPSTRLVDREHLPDTPVALWGAAETRALAIERFDRGPDRTLVHIEDMAQVRDFWPDQKYQGSFETLAKLIHRGSDDDALVEFVRRQVFNLLVDNSDAHLKNWSLVYTDPRRPTLSPAYDLVSLAPYDGYGGETGLRLGRTRHADRVRYAAFDHLATVTDRPGLDLADMARTTVEHAVAAWPEVAETCLPNHPHLRQSISEMITQRAGTLAKA